MNAADSHPVIQWHEKYAIGLASLHVLNTGNKFDLVVLSISLSMYVACPLAVFGGLMHPW